MSPFGADLKTFYECVISLFGTILDPNWTLFEAFSKPIKGSF